MPRSMSADEMTAMMELAGDAEAEQRAERIRSGDIPEGEPCPYCGEPVTTSKLHLTCF